MHTLSSTLTAAQKASSLVPFVKVQTRARSADVRSFSWTRYYTGSEGADNHAACMAGDGSLIRARVNGTTLYTQRVASPGVGSDYNAWTSSATGITASSPVALCASGANVWVFYLGGAGNVRYRLSTDYGATYGAAATVETPLATPSYLAAAAKGTGDLVCFWNEGTDVYTSTYASGAWGARTVWTNTTASITGIAAAYLVSTDYNLIVTGTKTGGDACLWQTILGDGYSYAAGTWGPLVELQVASSGSNVVYQQPAVGKPDVWRLWYLEVFSGTTAYNRPYWSTGPSGAVDFVDLTWREPVPFDLTSSTKGVALAWSATGCWLSIASGVWYAAISATVNTLTTDVLAVEISEDARDMRAVVTLRNDDGRYNTAGASVGYLGKGYQLEISLGATTSAGDETGDARLFWIQRWERRSQSRLGDREQGRAVVVVEAVGPWGLLERWRARRQIAWAAGAITRYNLLKFVLARVALELSSTGSTSAEMTTDQPAFVINPGEDGASVVRRLLAQVPEILYWRRATGYVKQVAAADASSYTYGTDHAIWRAAAAVEAARTNRVQVWGAGVLEEEFDWTEISAGGDYLEQVDDLNLDNATKAAGRADAEVREWELAATPARLVVPVHCGVELYDVVTVTDSYVDLSSAKRRIRGYKVRYARTPKTRGDWELEMALGGA